MKPNGLFASRLFAFLSSLLFLLVIVLFPIREENLVSFSKLNVIEVRQLKITAAMIALTALFLFFFRKKLPVKSGLYIIAILLLLLPELLFRMITLTAISGKFQDRSIAQSNWTFDNYSKYQGHPFLQFNGRIPNDSSGRKHTPFNNYGFAGRDFQLEKDPSVIRIACLGESTTEDGYPAYLEQYLNNHTGHQRYEVMNFGHSFWTSAHSLVNLLLVVVDFKPDILVLHHGWNEQMIRNAKPGTFRNDYTHTLKTFSRPFVYDKFLIRIFALYRFLKFYDGRKPAWIDLGGTISNKENITETGFHNPDELIPFRRNMMAMINNGKLNGMEVFVVTIPRSTDTTSLFFNTAPNIDQCNDISRQICQPATATLIDLDSLMTGRNELFRDVAHNTEEGKKIKATHIGNVILRDSTSTVNKFAHDSDLN